MTGTVLVVEDGDDIRELLEAALISGGYTVITAEDGLAGLGKAYFERPDLIVTDLNLPKVSGVEVIKRLRAEESFSSIPIIALTAYPQEYMGESIRAGADRALTKPVDLMYLLTTVDRLVSSSKAASGRI